MWPDADIILFDMDHTLIDNDCDVSWKEFLIAEGLAPPSEHDDIYRFWDLYCQGQLPEKEFLGFQLRQFVGRTPEEMAPLVERHFAERVRPSVFPQAKTEVRNLVTAGRPVAALTATNRMVATPVCRGIGIHDVIATELDTSDGRFTGRIQGAYCIGEGKIARAEAYCLQRGFSLDRAVYYGDSVSDIPMLKRVGFPVAVNPGEKLLALARKHGMDAGFGRGATGRDVASFLVRALRERGAV